MKINTLGMGILVLLIGICVGIGIMNQTVNHGRNRPPELQPAAQPQVIELKFTGEGKEKVFVKENKDIVHRSMEVDNPEANLSGICSIIDNVGYMQIYSTISVTESRSFWMDTHILKQRYGITKIRLFLNSGGGSAYDGIALADLIEGAQKDGFEIEAFASGLVASAAVPVFAACAKRTACDGCVFMVHKAKLFKYIAQEDINDLEAQKEMMRIIRLKYLGIMANHSKLTKTEWEKLLEKTTWFTAKQALEWGLVDEVE